MKTSINQTLIENIPLFDSKNNSVNCESNVIEITKNESFKTLFRSIGQISYLIWLKIRTAVLTLGIMVIASLVLSKLLVNALDTEYEAQQQVMLTYEEELKTSLPFDAPSEDQ